MYQAPDMNDPMVQQQMAMQQQQQMQDQNMVMQDQAMMQQQQQVQQMQQQPAMQPPGDPVAEAKAMLGLDKIEEYMQQTTMKAIQSEMKAKYPEVSEESVKAELSRIEKDDPALAAAMMKSAQGLETVYKAIVAQAKPKDTPDDITDSAGNAVGDTLDRKIKSGKASQIELGDYILGFNG